MKVWPNNIVLPFFQGLYTNISDNFEVEKFHRKVKGFLTIFRPILNFRNKTKV